MNGREGWPEVIPLIQFAINSAPTASTRYSPFQVLYGSSPITPVDIVFGYEDDDRPKSWDVGDATVHQLVRRW